MVRWDVIRSWLHRAVGGPMRLYEIAWSVQDSPGDIEGEHDRSHEVMGLVIADSIPKDLNSHCVGHPCLFPSLHSRVDGVEMLVCRRQSGVILRRTRLAI